MTLAPQAGAGGTSLVLHLVLRPARGATNAIVVWGEHCARLGVAPASERAATARALALNLAVPAVLGGVQAGDPASLRPARAWSARSCWCMPSP